MKEQEGEQPPLPSQLGHDFFNSIHDDQVLLMNQNAFSIMPPPPHEVHQHFHDGLMITYNNNNNHDHFSGLLTTQAGILNDDLGVQTTSGCGNFASIAGPSSFGFGGCGACELGSTAGFPMVDYAVVSRTASCPPAVLAAAMAEVATPSSKRRREILMPEKLISSNAGRQSFKKRKSSDKTQNHKATTAGESKDEKSRGCQQEEPEGSKVTEQKTRSKNITTSNTEASETSKENSKISAVQKPDYIHVRARRGQATDSHSLAERVRREKISERMKFLQDLVPGCNKITGKAGMLDEIINYVQSLQKQVEFLSMKLAALNPMLDFNINDIFTLEIFPVGTSELQTMASTSEISHPPNYPSDPLQQVVSCCGLETVADPPEMALRRTISAPISIHETLKESPYFSQIHPTWDAELHSLCELDFQQAKSTSLLSQPCTAIPTPCQSFKQDRSLEDLANVIISSNYLALERRLFKRQRCKDADLNKKSYKRLR